MRDLEPTNAAFDDSLGADASPSGDEWEMETATYDRPSWRHLDVHERPTLIP
jgi:hypothetical protein